MLMGNRSKTKKGWLFFAVPILLLLGDAPRLSADIYVYRDAQGVLHFSNVPTSFKYTNFMKEAEVRPAAELPSGSYDKEIEEAAAQNDLSSDLLKALIYVESSFDPYAISKKGALGLMQIMPENLELLNIENPFDPRENVMGGARYLKTMIDRFGGNIDFGIAAYNAGPSAVEKYNGIPPYEETEEYVQKVLELYSRYKNS